MHNKYLLLFLFLFCGLFAQAQKVESIVFGDIQRVSGSYFNLEGIVSGNNGPLEDINILLPGLGRGTLSDSNGKYAITLPLGTHILELTALGYESKIYQIEIYQDGKLNVFLEEATENLDEVVIVSNEKTLLESEMIGKTTLNTAELKEIPLVLGEQNILKAATLLPGISTTGEAATGFNVRGGKADQNLILLNGTPIVNPNHFFGIFQALNPFAIESLNVYKGNIPIEYEGRTSSVFEITTQSPSTSVPKGDISVGPITANASVQLPVRKDKSGLLLGFRSAHSDWILKALKDPKLKKSSASFLDGILTYEDQIGAKDKISATTYYSQDAFSITSDSLYRYSNALAAINWKHQFNEKNSVDVLVNHSGYDFAIRYDGGVSDNFERGFQMKTQGVKLKFTSLVDSLHTLTYGANLTRYGIVPGTIRPLSSTDLILKRSLVDENALEGSLYFSDRIDFSERLRVSFGIQLALYAAFGPYTENEYQEGIPKSDLTVLTTNTIPKGEVFARYAYPSYRIAGRYKIGENTAIKFAALRMYQFIHSLTNNTTASPIDTWRISTNHLLPQSSDQISLGVFSYFDNAAIEVGIEGFYKKQNNLVDFKTGAQLFLNPFIETEVIQGKGKAYGVELLIRKKSGKHTGWLGYTFSRSLIQLDSPFSEERVNNGDFFPTNYDKPHDVNLTWTYALHPNLSFSSNLTYQTGRPVTLPSGNYIFNQAEYVLFSDRNEFRIPDYYRVDLSLNYNKKTGEKRRIKTSWNASVYNVFGRNNPFSVYFVTQNGEIKGRQSSIFNVPIPAINLNFSF